jgi:hypothetical protein
LNLRPLGYEQNNARLVSLARYPLTSQNHRNRKFVKRTPSVSILTGTPKSGGWDGPTMICVEPGPTGR